MDARTAAIAVKEKVEQLETVGGQKVFDEWAMVQIQESYWKVLAYQTPRKEAFKANFKADVSSLKSIDPTLTQIGEFEFTREGLGTKFDAYLCAGKNIFFLFNHTVKKADEITSDPTWKTTERQINELQVTFVTDPVELLPKQPQPHKQAESGHK